MKTIDDALELRRRIFGAFEMAETAADPIGARRNGSRSRSSAPARRVWSSPDRSVSSRIRSLRDDFRAFDPESVRVILLDAGKEPVATFGHDLSEHAARQLAELGVELRMGARVTGIDTTGRRLATDDGNERLGARTVVWAAGVQASPLAALLADATGADVDRSGRIAVLPDLTLPGHPEVFAVGDMTTLDHLPGVAEVAMQGGLHSARTIARRLDGDDRSIPFTYRDLGSVATIGRFRAICSFGRVRLSGLPAWVVWLFVHLAFLNGYANRGTTVLRWLRWMVGRSRVERVFSVAHTGGDLSTPDKVRARGLTEPVPRGAPRRTAADPGREP